MKEKVNKELARSYIVDAAWRMNGKLLDVEGKPSSITIHDLITEKKYRNIFKSVVDEYIVNSIAPQQVIAQNLFQRIDLEETAVRVNIKTFGALEAGILSIVVGSIAIIFGIFNIKDFFFPKKGASLSIPEEKKPGLYKQMRNIVKTPSVFAAIIGTIFLAVTVNLFELLCSLQWPLYYIARLSQYNFTDTQNYMHIIFYNIVYVIPLIVIVLLFIFSISRMKISEWQGQKLKLFSGIMIFSFGLLFIIDYKILEDFVTPIALLLFSIVSTVVISYIWMKCSGGK